MSLPHDDVSSVPAPSVLGPQLSRSLRGPPALIPFPGTTPAPPPPPAWQPVPPTLPRGSLTPPSPSGPSCSASFPHVPRLPCVACGVGQLFSERPHPTPHGSALAAPGQGGCVSCRSARGPPQPPHRLPSSTRAGLGTEAPPRAPFWAEGRWRPAPRAADSLRLR